MKSYITSPWYTHSFQGHAGRASGGAAHDIRRGSTVEKPLSTFTMQRTSVLHALLLLGISLQLQSASGSPPTWSDNFVHAQIPVTASDLIKKAEAFVKVYIHFL